MTTPSSVCCRAIGQGRWNFVSVTSIPVQVQVCNNHNRGFASSDLGAVPSWLRRRRPPQRTSQLLENRKIHFTGYHQRGFSSSSGSKTPDMKKKKKKKTATSKPVAATDTPVDDTLSKPMSTLAATDQLIQVTTTTSQASTSIGSENPTLEPIPVDPIPSESPIDVVKSPAPVSIYSRVSSFVSQGWNLWQQQSGTAEVMELKKRVSDESQAFDQASAEVLRARRTLDERLGDWERSSGQHMQLLQRKEAWTSADVQEFATIVSKEVETKTLLETAREDLSKAERQLSQSQHNYMNAMRQRYHEEQIWQDQWRVLGTYGTWALIGLNSCVFMASQFFHYRREAQKMKRLEDLVKDNVASHQAFREEFAEQHQKDQNVKQEQEQQQQQQQQQQREQQQERQQEKVQAATGAPLPASEASEVVTESAHNEPALSELALDIPDSSSSWENDDYIPVFEWIGDGLVGAREWIGSKIELPAVVKASSYETDEFGIRAALAGIQVPKLPKKSLENLQHQTKEAFKEVHAPSVALGATVTGITIGTAFLLTSLLGRSSR